MQQLKVSTAGKVMLKAFLSSDHVTAATGKTLTVTLSKNGGAFASAGGSVAELTSGWYAFTPNTTDTNTQGPLVIRATAAACDDIEIVSQVVVDLPGVAQTGDAFARLPSDPADASDLLALLTSIIGYVDTEVAAIKAKTDQLIFTKTNELDVNLQSVNGVTLAGDGEGTPIGAA